MKKATQYFSEEYLDYCKTLTTAQILEFLENFRQLHLRSEKPVSSSKLISIKIPEDLLEVFKMAAERNGVRYQTQIKNLMWEWVKRVN